MRSHTELIRELLENEIHGVHCCFKLRYKTPGRPCNLNPASHLLALNNQPFIPIETMSQSDVEKKPAIANINHEHERLEDFGYVSELKVRYPTIIIGLCQ